MRSRRLPVLVLLMSTLPSFAQAQPAAKLEKLWADLRRRRCRQSLQGHFGFDENAERNRSFHRSQFKAGGDA